MQYAGGAYATVLALRALSENAQITYSTGLEIVASPEKKYEIDFAFWHRRRPAFDGDEEPALAFGEAKSFAEESFRTRDIERMETLGKAFPGAFLVFATMKDALSKNEKAAIGELALSGREVLKTGQPRNPVIVLTGAEMFSEWHIQHSWENLGGRHIANRCLVVAFGAAGISRRGRRPDSPHHGVELAVAVATHDHRSVSDEGGLEVAGVWQFRVQRHIVPRTTAEQPFLFALVNRRIREDPIWDASDALALWPAKRK
jgi:hypothetical protein